MGNEKRLFKSEERKTLAEASAFLYQLGDKLAAGEMTFRQGETETVLQLPESVILEIEVEEEQKHGKGTRYKVEIEIKWQEDASSPAPGEEG
jgi:amphi-Trp domain-containing protein